MPPRAVSAALAYLHQWQRVDAPELVEDVVLAACLLLASKVEEAATSNNHLLNVVRLVTHLERERISQFASNQAQSIGFGADSAAGRPASHGREDLSGGVEVEDGVCKAVQQHKEQQPQHGQLQAVQEYRPGCGTGGSCGGFRDRGRSVRDGSAAQDDRYRPDGDATAAAGRLLLLPSCGASHRWPASRSWLRLCIQRCSVLVGADYYHAKHALLDAEQRLLRALQFRVPVPQPHALVLNAARALRLPVGVQRLALALLNDLWTYSDFCFLLLPQTSSSASQPPPGVVQRDAATEATMAVLAAAARLSSWEMRVPSHAREMGLHWWQLLGVARDERGMRELVAEVMGACTACHEIAARAAAEGLEAGPAAWSAAATATIVPAT